MIFAKAINTFIGKYRGGSKNSIIVKSEALGGEYQSKSAFAPGLEINPGEGERIILTKIGGSNSYMVNIAGLSDAVVPDTLPGERRMFSVGENGALSAYLKLLKTGVVEINGKDDFAVLYNKLEVEFNELKGKYDSLVAAFNAHTHPVTAIGSPTGPPSAQGQASGADISNAKSDKVLLPSN